MWTDIIQSDRGSFAEEAHLSEKNPLHHRVIENELAKFKC